jgi:hypothetical protein
VEQPSPPLSKRWTTTDKKIFIDRSPHIFKHVLSLLRDSQYDFPKKYLFELDFFGIEYTATEEPPDPIVTQLEEMKTLLRSLQNDVNTIKNDVDTIERYGRPPKICKKRDRKATCGGCGCWESHLLIMTPSGWVPSNQLKIGDLVMTPAENAVAIKEVHPYSATNKSIVDVNGIRLTYKHPCKIDDRWIVPRDHFEVNTVEKINLTNLVLEAEHEVIISDGCYRLTVATLGRFKSIDDMD